MLNVLIAESEELDAYEVIGVVENESEARELAADDMAQRERALEAGSDPICPYVYKMYQRGIEGYTCVLEIQATEVYRLTGLIKGASNK